jgi:hypothetical protein
MTLSALRDRVKAVLIVQYKGPPNREVATLYQGEDDSDGHGL